MLFTLPNEIFSEILSYLNIQELINVEKSFAIDLPVYLYKLAHKRKFSNAIAEINSIIYTLDQDDSHRINSSCRVDSRSTTRYNCHSGSFLTFDRKYANGVRLPKNITYNRYAYKPRYPDDECGHSPYTGVSTYSWLDPVTNITDGMITDDFVYDRKPIY